MEKNKRDILKSLAVGAAWSTPVVSSVVLPVHANTSVTEGTYWGLGIPGTGFGTFDPPEPGIHACIVVSNSIADVTFQGGNNIGRRNGTIPTDGTRGTATEVAISPLCTGPLPDASIEIRSISADSITLRVISRFDDPFEGGYDVVVPSGSCGRFPILDGSSRGCSSPP